MLPIPDTLSRDDRFDNCKAKNGIAEISEEYLRFDVEKLANGRYSYRYKDESTPEVADLLPPLNDRVLSLDEMDCGIEEVRKIQDSTPVTKELKVMLTTNTGIEKTRRLEKLKKLKEEVVLAESILVSKNNNDLPYVPEGKLRRRIIEALHNDPLAGHLSYETTLDRVKKRFYWEEDVMKLQVKEFCNGCHSCNLTKPYKRNLVAYKPFRIVAPWSDVHMDYVELPWSDGEYKYIPVIRDRFTKACELVTFKGVPDSAITAKKFVKRVLMRHGHPVTVTTDGGSHFKKNFKKLLHDEKIYHNVSLPYQHRTNSIAERLARSIEEYLRHYVDQGATNWKKFLPACQFALNTARNFSIWK